MRALVLGGTGAMGEPLVALAAAQGLQIYVTSRKRAGSSGGVHYLQGNAHDETFIRQILVQPWDVIIDFMVYRTEAFRRRLTLLLDATRHYVFISSARVYAGTERPITEISPRLLDVCRDESFLATDEYALAKARQEDLLRLSGRWNWTIIRPYITYARERLQFGVQEKEDWLYRALRGRSIVMPLEITERMTTLTSGRDVAAGICALIGQPRAMGEIFHVTAPKALRWADVLSIYLDVLEQHLGYRSRVVAVDATRFLGCHPLRHQLLYDRCYDRRFDLSKINMWLDTSQFRDVELELRTCLTEFLSAPTFKAINWRLEAIKDRISREVTPLSQIHGLKGKVTYLRYRYFKSSSMEIKL